MKKGQNMATQFYYRLPSDLNNDLALWSGSFSTSKNVSKTQARVLLAKKLNRKRLETQTLIVSRDELERGSWTADEIRAETCERSKPKRVKRVAKTVADVPTSFDEVQAMMKRFGLV